MRIGLLPLLSLAVLCLCACDGPKGSPEGSLKSYYSAGGKKDWETMAGILSQESLHVTGGPGRAAAYLKANLDVCTKLDFDVGDAVVTKDGDQATAAVTCKCRLIGKEDRKEYWVGCSSTYQLKKQADGNWYVVLPTSTQLKSRL